MTESMSPQDASAMPGAPHENLFSQANEGSREPHVSTGATGTREPTNTNTNIITALHKHNTNTHSILEEKSEYTPASSTGNEVFSKKIRVNVYLSEAPYRSFQSLIRSLGYSVSEFFNQIIISSVKSEALSPRPQININLAIAKSESKSVINVGEHVARKELDNLLEKVKALKARADRERQERDMPMTFTIEQSKVLEDSIKKALKSLRSLDSEKLREVEAALAVLKGIKEVKR